MVSLRGLIDPIGLTPHGFCLAWQPGLIWLEAVSDLIIAASYYSIPLALLMFVRRRADFAFPWLVWLFAAFIMACGATHMLGAVTLWVPAYRLDGVVKAVTAALSLATAIRLWPLLPRALALPSPAQLQQANAALRVEAERREATARQLAESEAALRAAEQRVRAEAALRDSEARWRTLAETLPVIVWTALPDGTIQYQNNRWSEFSGQPDGSVADDWAALVHPDDLPMVWRRWRDAVSSAAPFELEYRMRRQDGQYRWLLTRGVVMRDPAGAPLRWLGTSTDISDIVAARQALAQEADRLEQLVGERTQHLQETQAQLAHAQRLQALGQLAGGIAHDFHNVLQAVQGAAALIDEAGPDADPARLRRRTRIILQAVGRGVSITRRLLVFSRHGDLRAVPLDAAELFEGLSELLGHTLGGGVTVGYTAAPGLPPLLADRDQLETALVNLATNARDALADSGALDFAAVAETVTQESARQDPAHRRSKLPPGDYVRLSVRDTGCGMDAATLARAQEPFFTTKPVGRGTGLGLSVARGFAEQSGGALDIVSAPGQGTTVSLWFPVATHAPPSADPSPAPLIRAAPPPCRTVLVVDDEPLVRFVLTEQLEDAGYAVREADCAEAALRLLDDGGPVGLLLTDLSMPGMDGLALIRAARARRPELPALLLTGFANRIVSLAEAGKVSVLCKPVAGAALAAHVAAMLDGAGPGVVRAA